MCAEVQSIKLVLDQFENRYAQVFRGMTQQRIPHDRPELQMTVAAGMAGVPLGHPCREGILARAAAAAARRDARAAGQRKPYYKGRGKR